jgi:hypothetical protein
MQNPDLPGERNITLPAGWRSRVHPRRGGIRVSVAKVEPGAVAAITQLTAGSPG